MLGNQHIVQLVEENQVISDTTLAIILGAVMKLCSVLLLPLLHSNPLLVMIQASYSIKFTSLSLAVILGDLSHYSPRRLLIVQNI